MKLLLKIFILVALLLYSSFAPKLLPATEETGLKYFRNFSPREYDLAPQNWFILQSKEGLIYVANQGNVLEYDGISWQSIEITNGICRSIAIDNKGTIYVGGKNEIGYLAPDAKGTLHYVSLLGHLKDNQRNFSTVYSIQAAKDGVYFYTKYHLFHWNSEKMKVWKPEYGKRFNASFNCNGKFFIHQREIGLMHVLNNSLQLIPGDTTFADIKIFMMAPYDEQKILIGTRDHGFYLYDGKTSVAFSTEVDQYLKEKKICHGIQLLFSHGRFAIATREGGVVIIDSKGRLKQILDKSSGIRDDDVKSIFEDSSGNLWLALNDGISKIEYASPISIFDQQTGLPSMILSVTRHGPHNHLYVGTSTGVMTLDPDGQFRRISGLRGMCFSLLSVGNSLLAAGTYGVFLLDNEYSKPILEIPTYVLYRSRTNPNRTWLGTREGLVSLYLQSEEKWDTERWVKEHKIKTVKEGIRSIVEDLRGNLWLGTETKGVLIIHFPAGDDITQPVVTRYDTSHGLPDSNIHVSMVAEHVVFATKKGLFRFDEQKEVFLSDYTLGDDFAGKKKGKDVFRIVEDNKKSIWFHSDFRNFQAIPSKTGGTVLIKKKPFLRIPRTQVNFIYPDPVRDAIWFASNDGLIRYDTNVRKNYDLDFKTNIRKVLVNGELIFNGYKHKTDGDTKPYIPIIEYKNRKNLRFSFAASFFEAEDVIQYRRFLKGHDGHWSEWNSAADKEFTTLDSGQYVFRVQAKNIYGNLGSEDIFQFKILPPWYRTWWAYLLYAASAIFAVLFLLKWRSRKLVLDKKKLEQIVQERTQEVKDKNRQLEEQSEKLKEMDKIKSRFFANISHEFRTPITLILGPLEQMIAACGEKEKETKRKLTLMLRNAQRLLRLINQLLELSKLDSGKLKLQPVRTDIASFLKGIIASFQLLAHQKELNLFFHAGAETQDIVLDIDPRKMEDVMSNLLINAVKFTPPGGEITVTLNKSDFVEISVSDTGPGIPAEELTHIFDRFYQADSTYEFHQKGSGIGLALSKELVELHHGTIEARSREGEGSTFIIRLPDVPAESKASTPYEPKASAPYESAPALDIETADINETDTTITEKDIDDSLLTSTGALSEGAEAFGSAGTPGIVLVVEDSADMRNYIKGALEPDYTVVEARDGKEGIQKAQELIPDLIVSDIMMPETDGYELCRVLKSDVRTSHVPIILLTAKASEENILQGLETGADDYITKPFNTKILTARIKNLIDIRSQLQTNINREMTLQPVKTSVSKIDREFLKDLHDAINKNLSDDDFNVDQLCRKLYLSRTTLYRKVLAISGLTPTEYIRTYRLKRGAELLKKNFGTVLEVAFEVGFSNSSYFAKCFKEKFHQLPSEFQAANKE